MSLQACAEMVRKGDPDRFLSAMAVPPEARAVLFPIYAFNLEVARAPWVTAEPLIAEMRLQWWRDALDEIAGDGPVRRHEVTTPLADVLDATGAGLLHKVVDARRADIARQHFSDEAELFSYLDDSAGILMWVAARALGAAEGEADVRARGRAQGLANWFLAAPALSAAGWAPLPGTPGSAITALAETALNGLAEGRVPTAARPAVLAGWRAKPILKAARKRPERVMSGRLVQSEFRRKFSLLLASSLKSD